jgi:hypothetical protein
MSQQIEKLFTRKDALNYIKDKFGIPVSGSTIDKRPPQPDRFYGKKQLYSGATLDAYALTLIREKPGKVIE